MLLEFLKFRVLASQEVFFQAWLPGDAPRLPQPTAQALAELDLAAFRRWLQPQWPQAVHLADADLRHCLEQAHRLYIDPPPGAGP